MTCQIVKRAAVAAISATMLVSVAIDGATAGAAPTDGGVPECYLLVIDPVSRLYTELGIEEGLGAVLGPPRPTCPVGTMPDCQQPIVDPMSRLYLEVGFVEVPGAELGPDLPTCETGS